MKRLVPLLVIAAAVLVIPAAYPGTDGYTSAELSDGTAYIYETYGNDYGSYRSTIVQAVSGSEVLYISTVLEGYNVTEISANAFSGCAELKAAVIPERIKTIGPGAFAGCDMLGSVYFLGDAPAMAAGAFPSGVQFYRTEGSSGWGAHPSEIIEQHTVSSDGSEVTYYVIEGEAMAAKGLPSPGGSVTILSEVGGYPVTSVGPYSFSGKSNAAGTDVVPRSDVISVHIPEGVKAVRERAFYYCTGLEGISFPQTTAVIMDEAFRAAHSLSDAGMPSALRYIGFEAFRECSSLPRISIPDSVTFVGEGAFKICTGAESITVGKGVAEIVQWTFAYCSSASSAELRGNVESIGGSAFYMCGALRSISLPDTVESIGSGAFYMCGSLERASLGKSLVSVGPDAFSECTVLNSVRMPDTVSSVSSRAFAYCPGMTDIYFDGPMPEFGGSVFLNTDATVHCREAHKGSWAGFAGDLAADRTGGHPAPALILGAALAVLTVVAAVLVRRLTK